MQKKKHDQLRIRDSLKDLHKEIQKINKSKTPKELDMHERFEDVPERLANLDRDYGKVVKVSSSGITHMRKGGRFDD